MNRVIWTLLLAMIAQFAAASPDPADGLPIVDSIEVAAFGPQRSGFEVSFGDLQSDYRVMAMFALPGERVPIRAACAQAPLASAADYRLVAEAGVTDSTDINQWTWTAPTQPGVYPIRVLDPLHNGVMTLNVFVMVPYAEMRHGSVNGYRIGAYPHPRPGYEEEYQRPLGFVEVTPAMLDIQVSPHFRLGQFLCKQAGGSPQYLVLRQPLLVKLEQLLATVNERGIPARTFSIMSAYRTPSYNAAIGNVTTFSRHEYGDAADVFIDDDGDGIMDDLNHDGRHTVADARVLSAIVDELHATSTFAELIGGLGTYGPTTGHGPFVHVDVRGFSIEWGA
jgi:hypothetical protein